MLLASLFKNSSVPNKEIGAKLSSYKHKSAGWSDWYRITDSSKLGGDNIMLSLLPWGM